MRRILPDYAYGDGPIDRCWWNETAAAPDWPVAKGAIAADVAIVGGGYTGLSAALHLAEAGAAVVVLEARAPGWGASGRNGGFCCLGGGIADEAELISRFGAADARLYAEAERAAVALVAGLLERHRIDADTHSRGETQLAHSRRAMERLRRLAGRGAGRLTEADGLAAEGLGGPFFGALTNPVGFALNPRKYLFGLAAAAGRAGARMFRDSPVKRIARLRGGGNGGGSGGGNGSGGFRLSCGCAEIRADAVIVATNGYSSEDIPEWLAGRYMPAQSTVLVTRPLTGAELAAQGWTSAQMAFDTRTLLHYFRLMPDRRFLFGRRGGLIASPAAEARARAAARRAFERMFPAWAEVPATHSWSGLVCLARNRTPFVGAVPGSPGLFAGLAYHGNGVAMGSYAGRLLADLVLARPSGLPFPRAFRAPPARFALGRWRRALMWPVYGLLGLRDMLS